MYYKTNNGMAWHGPGVIAGTDGKIALVRNGGSLLCVSPVHLLPGHVADKQRADDTLSYSGQDGLCSGRQLCLRHIQYTISFWSSTQS